jgi:hypothetical protein
MSRMSAAVSMPPRVPALQSGRVSIMPMIRSMFSFSSSHSSINFLSDSIALETANLRVQQVLDIPFIFKLAKSRSTTDIKICKCKQYHHH